MAFAATGYFMVAMVKHLHAEQNLASVVSATLFVVAADAQPQMRVAVGRTNVDAGIAPPRGEKRSAY
ncbi:unnamed protein product [Urochloa humidicola]